MHRCDRIARLSNPATQPGQRCDSVQYVGIRCQDRSERFELSIAERLAKYGGGGTDCSLPEVAANRKHTKRKFAGIVLVSDNEIWVGTGRHGSTGVMAAWEAFVANRRNLAALHQPHGVSLGFVETPKLAKIDLQSYQTVQSN